MSISSVTMTNAIQATEFQTQPSAPSGSPVVAGSTNSAPVAGQQGTAKPEPSFGQLNQVVNQINQNIQAVNKNIQFSLDQQSGRVVVKVMDTQTNEVIRQIPSKEALALADALGKLQGIIIQQKA